MILTLIFILGLTIGSFLNVCIYRIPEGSPLLALPHPVGAVGRIEACQTNSCTKLAVPRRKMSVLWRIYSHKVSFGRIINRIPIRCHLLANRPRWTLIPMGSLLPP